MIPVITVYYALTDVQAPVVYNCSSDVQHFTDQTKLTVSWPLPQFADPLGNDVIVTSSIDGKEAILPWGDHVIQYTGRKMNNGLMTTCSFTISVDRKYTTMYMHKFDLTILYIIPKYNSSD